MVDRPTVAVIGAGFSGVLTAVRLLLEPDGPGVILIERGPRFGRGAAYSSGSPHHLLNVRAINMSAFVEQPAHFIEWLGRSGAEAQGQAFVTRDRYGRYLQSILRRASGEGAATSRLTLEHDEVRALQRDGHRWRLELGMGRTLAADAVVLALGNLPPPVPAEANSTLAGSSRYVADPWSWDPTAAPADGDVLILGAGLTAVDVALSVHAARPRARMLLLSRHGLLPRRHAGESAPAAGASGAPRGSPRAVFRWLRASARTDWHGAIDAVRPHVNGLWRSWNALERRQFLRHLRPWWDVHRHRLAPVVAEQIDELQSGGLLDVAAGRLSSLRVDGAGVHATWTPRGGGPTLERRFAVAINCSGPRADLRASGEALVDGLMQAGLIRADEARLGLEVDARSRLVGADGAPCDTLFAVGPIARGHFYEVISVPDIRVQAADCADAVFGALVLKSRRGSSIEDASHDLVAELAGFLHQSKDELDVELASLRFARRVRNAWELRGRKAAFDEILLWLEARRGAH